MLLGISIQYVSEKSWHITGVYEITRNTLNSQGKKSKGTSRLGVHKRKDVKKQLLLVLSQKICAVYFFRPKFVDTYQVPLSLLVLSCVLNDFLLVKAELIDSRHPCCPDQLTNSLGQTLSGGEVWTLKRRDAPGIDLGALQLDKSAAM